jgi:hypothetical protein
MRILLDDVLSLMFGMFKKPDAISYTRFLATNRAKCSNDRSNVRSLSFGKQQAGNSRLAK